MNQEVNYSVLWSATKRHVEREKGEKCGRCFIHLHLHPREPFWNCEQSGVFKTGIRSKWTYEPRCPTHYSDGAPLEVFNHRHTKACNSAWKQGAQFFKCTKKKAATIFPSINFPSFLSTSPFISPSIHQSIAVTSRVPLHSSDAAFQRRESGPSARVVTAEVCKYATQSKWAFLSFLFFNMHNNFFLQCVQTLSYFIICNAF